MFLSIQKVMKIMKPQGTYFRRQGCRDLGPAAGVVVRGRVGAAREGGLTIRRLVGEAGWWRLAPAVRERFGVSPADGERWHYRGVMRTVSMSAPGRAMAWISRIIGSPVAHLSGDDVPIDVFVYPERGGTAWERRYHFAKNSSVTAKTVKKIDRYGRMLECFGAGTGMELDVYEANNALHFRSTAFFVDMGGGRARMPASLSPGTLLVEHIDEGRGWFRFRMTVEHTLFGRMFFQDGVFARAEEA